MFQLRPLACLYLLLITAYADAEGSLLQVPAEYHRRMTVTEVDSDFVCPDTIEPYISTLSLTSKYLGSDDSKSSINTLAEAEYLQSVETIRAMEKMAASASDEFVKGESFKAAQCFLADLSDWADAGAMLNGDVNETGQAVRKWFLAAAGVAYLKIRSTETSPLTLAGTANIETWFARLGAKVVEFYSDRSLDKVNNHDYWAAWAVMVTAINLQDHDMYQWAISKFKQAAAQIDSDGYLANELARENKALIYHNFALQPLVMVAVFALANGDDIAGSNDDALARLATRVTAGLQDPQLFADITGVDQDVDSLYSSYSLAWIVPYCKYYDMGWPAALDLESISKFANSRLGGDLTWQFDVNLPETPTQENAVLQ